MKETDYIVYFEDTDDINDIKSYFKNLQNKIYNYEQKCIHNNAYERINSIIDLHQTMDLNLHPSKIEELVTILKKSNEYILNLNDKLLQQHTISFIALLDYIFRKEIQQDSEFFYIQSIFGYQGNFKGVFKDELRQIEEFIDISPISLYSMENDIKDAPMLDMKNGFNKCMESIENNFLDDLTKEKFNTYLQLYLDHKNTWFYIIKKDSIKRVFFY